MKPRVPIGLLAFCVGVASSYAADGEAGAATQAQSKTARSGLVSQRLSAAIRSSLPTYEELAKQNAPEPDDFQEEGVIVLKTMNVIERRQPKALDWQMLSDEGRGELLKERYMGATIPGARLTEMMHNYGMAMQREDTRLSRLSEIDDTLNAAEATGDAEYLRDLKQDLYKTRMRPNDMRMEAMDKSINRYRQP